jgi:hypothetical protein
MELRLKFLMMLHLKKVATAESLVLVKALQTHHGYFMFHTLLQKPKSDTHSLAKASPLIPAALR